MDVKNVMEMQSQLVTSKSVLISYPIVSSTILAPTNPKLSLATNVKVNIMLMPNRNALRERW